MAQREIVRYPDPVLRMQAKQVKKIDANVKKLVNDMIETLQAVRGYGLAAPQVGVPQRIFVYNDNAGTSGVMINPKLSCLSGKQTDVEGCLSIPGLQGDVSRAYKLEIRATDINDKPVKIEAEGLLARIFQHEFDHLEGKIFTDLADPDTLHYVDINDEDDDEEDYEEDEE